MAKEERPRLGREQLSQIRRLFVFARPYRSRIMAATVAVAFASGLGLVFPRIMGTLVDTALDRVAGDTGSLDRIALLLIGVFLAQAAFNFLRTYFLAAMGEGIVADLRTATYSHLMTLPVNYPPQE